MFKSLLILAFVKEKSFLLPFYSAICNKTRPCLKNVKLSKSIQPLIHFSFKAPNDPLSCGNTPYSLRGEISDRTAQPLDNLFQRRKDLVPKALTAQLSPELLDEVHLGG